MSETTDQIRRFDNVINPIMKAYILGDASRSETVASLAAYISDHVDILTGPDIKAVSLAIEQLIYPCEVSYANYPASRSGLLKIVDAARQGDDSFRACLGVYNPRSL
jgi:hypothetical protein